MSKLMNIYNHSPITVQHVFTSTSGLLKARKRYGRIYQQHRRWLQNYDSWPLEEKLVHNSTELQEFLKYVSSHSRYYTQLYSGIDLDAIKTHNDIDILPVVDKEILRANIDEVYTIPKREAILGQTGGTTGKPLLVRYTVADSMRRMAMLDHFKSRHGFQNRKMLKATFSGKPIVPPSQEKPVYWRYNRAARQFLYSTFHLNDSSLPYYVAHLNKTKPRALDGFISSLTEIAKFIESNNLTLSFRPLAIFPTAETVLSHDRELLERVFQCKVYDQYASSEGAPFVTECSHSSLHIELSTGIFENLPGTDEILVTSFTTHGTPLIRYQIGDSMKIDFDGACPCGLRGPIVESIYGRAGDYLVRTDGAKVIGAHIANLFKGLPTVVIKAQVTQEVLGEITILLRVEDGSDRTQITKKLEKEVLNAFGEGTTAKIEFVDQIPRAPSGKHRLVRNLLSKDLKK